MKYGIVWCVTEALEDIPPAFREAVEAPRFRDASSQHLAAAMARVSNLARRGKLKGVDDAERYLSAVVAQIAKDGATTSEDGIVRECMGGTRKRKLKRESAGRYVREAPTPSRARPDETLPLPAPPPRKEPPEWARPPAHRSKPAPLPIKAAPPKVERKPPPPPDLNATDDVIIACDPSMLSAWVRGRVEAVRDDESPGLRVIAEVQAQSERLRLSERQAKVRADVANRALESVSAAAAS